MTVYFKDHVGLEISCDWEGCVRKIPVILPDDMKKGWGFMANPSDPLSDLHFCPDHVLMIIKRPEIKEEIRKYIKPSDERDGFFK